MGKREIILIVLFGGPVFLGISLGYNNFVMRKSFRCILFILAGVILTGILSALAPVYLVAWLRHYLPER